MLTVTDSETAKKMMPDYHIGTLNKADFAALESNTNTHEESTEPRPVFLQSRSWTKAKLSTIKKVSWDTRIFTLQLEHENQKLGLPIGQHFIIRVPDPSTKETIIRSYTPISDTDKTGTVDLLVKIYFATPTIPSGKMTMALDQLPLGSMVECKGPTGRFEYMGNGKVVIGGSKEHHVRSFRMICGGTGITPIFQVLRAVMQDTVDPTRCVVLDGNRQEEDILCRDELDTFSAAANAHKCQIVHTLSKAPDAWTGRKGRISEDLLKEYASPDDESMVLICGPETMEKSAKQILLALGWDESSLHFF